MKCEKLVRMLEEYFSTDYAENWDNVGLLAGNPDKEVKKILVALDASDRVIGQAAEMGADMLITHHPLIFSPVKKITADNFIGRRIYRLIREDIAYYAMHTNYDILRMADGAADRMGLADQEILETVCMTEDGEGGFGKVGNLTEPMTLEAYAARLKEIFGLPGVTVYGERNRSISRAAVCPGSGKSFLDSAVASGADVYVTGDVDYHFGTDANARGIAVIDAGHYGVEHIFIEDMKGYLTKLLEGEDVIVETVPVEHPYFVVS